MIEVIILFLVAAVISFAGSLQPGPVNLAVIHTSLSMSFRKSLVVATGGIIPELIYSSLAIWLSLFILANEWLNEIIRLAAIVVFLIIGITFFFKKEKKQEVTVNPAKEKLFMFGFLAGIFNPMMFPFWLMIVSYINNSGLILVDQLPKQIAFVLGTASGAFILLYLAAFIAQRKREQIFALLPAGINRILGSIFLLLAVWEAAKYFYL